jgi:hypothetical protein
MGLPATIRPTNRTVLTVSRPLVTWIRKASEFSRFEISPQPIELQRITVNIKGLPSAHSSLADRPRVEASPQACMIELFDV